MSSSLINTAMSGIKAAQTALGTISSNIANAKVEGYHRQTTTLATDGSGMGNTNGVNVTGIMRQYDEFINANYNKSLTKQAELNAYAEHSLQLDKLMSTSDTDLAAGMTDFFTNLQKLETDAASEPLRNTMINKAQAMVNRFKSVDGQFKAMEQRLNGNIGKTTDQISQLAQQVAKLNGEMTKIKGMRGEVPNAMLDQREQLVRDLANLTGIDVIAQGDGVNINLSNGLSLVNGSKANKISAMASAADPADITLGYDDGINPLREIDTTVIKGGKLAGMLAVRDELLEPNRQKINQLGLILTDSLNQVQRAGFDLQGNTGQDIFQTGQPNIISHNQNQGSNIFATQFTDVMQVKGIDYTMSFDGINWQVTQTANGTRVNVLVTPSAGNQGTKLAFDGIEIEVATISTPQAGDKFIIKPTDGIIAGMSVAMTDPKGIAAADQAASGQADNTNIKQMLALQDKKLVNGISTLSQSYAVIVSEIATKASSANSDLKAQSVVTKSYFEQQQSVAGVNLDEEYLEMSRMQEFYMSNAKVIQTANYMFETLIRALN